MALQHHNKLNILNWNANGINNKKAELSYFLKAKEIKLACITETHLKPNETFKIPGYNNHRSDRINSNGGGVLILIEKSIPYIQSNLPHTPGIETVAIKFPLDNRIITLIAAYKPPKIKIHSTNFGLLFQQNTPQYLSEISIPRSFTGAVELPIPLGYNCIKLYQI